MIAAAALPAMQIDGDVPQFARQAAMALYDPPAVHHAQARAFADIEHGKIGHALGADPYTCSARHNAWHSCSTAVSKLQPVAKIGAQIAAVELMQDWAKTGCGLRAD